jgi:hypothetical protein
MVTPSPPDPADEEIFAPDFAPVPLLRRRRGGWTPERQRTFIAILANTGSVGLAARCVGLSPRSAYDLRTKPGADAFDDAWQEAIEVGRQRVRDKLMDRWRHGQIVPVRRRGKIVRYERRFNDGPLVAVLASARNETARNETAGGDWWGRALRQARRDHVAETRERATGARQAEAEQRTAGAETARWIAETAKPAPPRIRTL